MSSYSADVYTAWSTKHGKKVVLKQFRKMKDDLSFSNKLANEIRIWAELEHRYVLPFLGFVVEGNGMIPTFVSEWMERGTVDFYMQNFPRGGEDTWNMVSRISSGLAFLHSKDVIHADLKCGNILISMDGEPLVADFGISLALSETYTGSYNAKGTGRWMAIELLASPEDDLLQQTKMSDMWAFGMVIYELLSGQIPYFEKKADARVILAICSGEIPTRPITDRRFASLSDVLWRICCYCWRRNPEKRPTADDIEYLLNSRSRFFCEVLLQ